MTDTPTTAAGRDHHDLAWSKDTVMPCDHTFSRDICPGCAHDRAIEQEAVTRALAPIRWFIDHNPDAEAVDLRDGIRFLLDEQAKGAER
jgi:hypothetical protein